MLDVVQLGLEWGQPNPKIYVLTKTSGRVPAISGNKLVHYPNSGPVTPDGGIVTLEATIPLNLGAPRLDRSQRGADMCIWGVVQYETGFHHVPGETGFGSDYLFDRPHDSYGDRFAATTGRYNYAR